MKRRINTRVVAGVLALSLAVLGWVRSQRLTLQSLSEGLGSAFFPWMILAVIALLGILLLLLGLFGREEEGPRMNLLCGQALPMIGVSVSLLVYAILLVPLGFLAATAGFLLTTSLILKARPVPAALFAILTTAGLWTVFGLALRVPLP